MPVGATVFDQISNVAIQNAGSIVFAGLHYRYERFKSNAASSNLVYISNNKIYDTPGRPTTPYEVRDAFAMVPLRTVLIGAVHTFLFKPELFYSNTGKTINTLKIDFNDGVGFRTITANIPVAVTYSTEGEKKLIFKVTYTDATSVESHTKVDVREIPTQHAQARYAGQNIDEFIFPMAGYTTKPYLGIVGGALVTVEYANPAGACQDKSLLFFGTRVQGTSYSISPNPATDFLTITANPKGELPESEATDFTEELEYVVKINDTETGELLFTSKPVKGKPKEQIDISKLPKGLYTIQVVEKEGVQSFKFLKK